jgi:hypothetical protein
VQQNGNTVNRVQQGLQQVVSWSAGTDVNWALTDRISFSTGYVHESNFQKQRGSVRNPLDPSLDWISDSTDTVDTFHGSIKATILPQKLDFTFNGSYSYTLGRVEQRHPEVRVRVGQVRRRGRWLPAPESPSCRCPSGASTSHGSPDHQSAPARNLVITRGVSETAVRHAACERSGKQGCS